MDKSEELKLYNLKDYEIFGDCRSDHRSGGIIIYCHTNSGFILQKKGFKTAEMASVFNRQNGNCIMGLNRDHGFTVAEFCEELDENLKKLQYGNVYVIGDINIDLKGSENKLNHYLNVMANSGMHSAIDLMTRFVGVGAQPSCLDHVFFRNKQGINNFFLCLQPPFNRPYACHMFNLFLW